MQYDGTDIYLLNNKNELLKYGKVVLSNVIQFSCGQNFTVAITTNGCYGWGYNHVCQLGLRSANFHATPILLHLDMKMVACENYYATAILHNVDVYIWGYNNYVGISHLPKKLNVSNIVAVTCSYNNSYYLDNKHQVYKYNHVNVEMLHIQDVIMMRANKTTVMFLTKSLDVYTQTQLIYKF